MKPTGTRIIAVAQAPQTKTSSGLLLNTPTTQPPIAVITTVGPDVKTIKAKQTILYTPASALKVTLDGTDHLIIEERDVLAILST